MRNRCVDLCRISVELPFSEIDELHERAQRAGLTLDDYVRWCVRTCGNLRFVPVIGTCH